MLKFNSGTNVRVLRKGIWMLSDRDRKLLRIIANYSAGRGRFPTLKELQIKSGRSRADVMDGLKVLEQERYIELDGNGQIRNLLEAWERPAFRL